MNDREQSAEYVEAMDAGQRALDVFDWSRARHQFEIALTVAETPEALERFGLTAWWLDDAPALFESRKRAYALYRDIEDAHGSARLAIWLALDYYIFRHAPAVSNGWMKRAQRILDDLPSPSFEHCFLAYCSGHIALEEHNIVETQAHARRAIELARQIQVIDFEMLSLALLGLALVSQGEVDTGMSQLDEAVTAATSGELSDPDAIVTACCYLFYACERVGDFDRAAQWCATLAALCERFAYRSMVSVCRAHYGAILMWQGNWAEAEKELESSADELMAGRAGWAPEAFLRLGELRRRQARTEDARRLFDLAPEHPLALLGKGEMALDAGDPQLALDVVRRYLRRVPVDEVTERFKGLDLAIRVHLELGESDSALEHARQMEEITETVRSGVLYAASWYARGCVSFALGDLPAAQTMLEDTIDLYVRNGAPFECARARVALARVLQASGKTEIAAAECQAAIEQLSAIGAVGEIRHAGAVLHSLDPSDSLEGLSEIQFPGLTPRESEILHFIARGLNNQQIAERLFLSVRTVERHVSTIYQKIGAQGRSARALATAYAFRHGSD